MRVGTRRVFDAWVDYKEDRTQNAIWTDGESIYSYGTVLLIEGDTFMNKLANGMHTASRGKIVLNRTTYSKTTTTHQNGLATLLTQSGIEFEEVDNIPMGTKSLDLSKI
jgi:hypothetical protein